jgi:hypothetical protein
VLGTKNDVVVVGFILCVSKRGRFLRGCGLAVFGENHAFGAHDKCTRIIIMNYDTLYHLSALVLAFLLALLADAVQG